MEASNPRRPSGLSRRQFIGRALRARMPKGQFSLTAGAVAMREANALWREYGGGPGLEARREHGQRNPLLELLAGGLATGLGAGVGIAGGQKLFGEAQKHHERREGRAQEASEHKRNPDSLHYVIDLGPEHPGQRYVTDTSDGYYYHMAGRAREAGRLYPRVLGWRHRYSDALGDISRLNAGSTRAPHKRNPVQNEIVQVHIPGGESKTGKVVDLVSKAGMFGGRTMYKVKLENGETVVVPAGALRQLSNPDSLGNVHRCEACGKDMGNEWILGPVCGKCVRKRHAEAVGRYPRPAMRKKPKGKGRNPKETLCPVCNKYPIYESETRCPECIRSGKFKKPKYHGTSESYDPQRPTPKGHFNPTDVYHDPFARETLVREQVAGSCAWCGNKNARGKCFRYGTERDDRPGRIEWDNKTFCSKGDRDTYYGI